LPLLMKIKFAQGKNPRALIVAPTRELAMQINEHLTKLARYLDVRHTAIYGGLGPKTQIAQIEAGMDILVCTPGRLMDLYLNGTLILKEIKILVIDEADKMMDMGFMPQIRALLEVIPRKRQNLLFSATMPERVLKLSEEFLEFPVRVEVSPQATPVETVTQVSYKVPNFKTKLNFLLYLLSHNPDFDRVILFVKTRTDAENISKFMERRINGKVRVIHANKGQNSRINAMDAFKEGGVRLLVATDVAARGLDISLVSHVINFDVPVIYEDYVHRIGRTGRAKQVGKAITFVHQADEYHLAKIEKIIRMSVPREPLPGDLIVEPTPKEEEQDQLRTIDDQRKKEDPTFKGAFHEKKRRPGSPAPSKTRPVNKTKTNNEKKSAARPKTIAGVRKRKT
jgi:ATP-dependent RNA helicase RhlE